MVRPEHIRRAADLSTLVHLQPLVGNVLLQEVLAQPGPIPAPGDQAVQDRIRNSVLVPALLDAIPLFVTDANELATLRREITNGNRDVIASTYVRAVRWLQTEQARVAGQLGQRLIRSGPGGVPLPVENGLPISPELHAALVRTGHLALPLAGDTSVIFGANASAAGSEINRFDDAVQWMRNSMHLLNDSIRVHQSRSLARFFQLNGFPDSYQLPSNPAAVETYFPRAQEVANVYMMVRNYAQIMLSLHGTSGINVSAIDELRALGIDIRYNMSTREFDPNHFGLAAAMPPNLDATVANEEMLRPLRAWLARHRPTIEQVLGPLEQATRDAIEDRRRREAAGEVLPPAPFLRWGHEEHPGVRRVNGEARPYDFIDHDFTITRNGDNVTIHRTLRYYRRRLISPYNFNVDEVGEPVTDEITRPASALFPTVGQMNSIGMERMDNLESWRSWQQAFFGAQRYGGMALDVGMIVTGTRGIYMAARAAAMGTATRLAVSRALAYNLFHIALGTGGIIEHSLPPGLNDARRVAMALDVVGGTFSGRWRNLSEVGHAAQSGLLRRLASDPGLVLMLGGGVATFPLVGRDIGRNVSGERSDNRPLFNQALGLFDFVEAPEGPHVEGARRPLFDFQNPATRDGVLAILSDNAATLFPGVAADQLPREIRDILQETRGLLGRPLGERQAYCNQLVQRYFAADGNQLARLHESLRAQNLTPEQIRQECLRLVGNPSRTQIVAAAALLLLSIDGNGQLPTTLGSSSITVPHWQFNVSAQGGGVRVEQQGPEVHNFQLQTADLIAILRRAAVNTTASPEQLVAAETLWHYRYREGTTIQQGLTDTQLAGVYLTAMRSNNVALQRRVLMGAPNGINLGVLLHELQTQESLVPLDQRDAFVTQRYGLLPADILAFLNQRAASVQNPDIRAALLGIHGALAPNLGNRRSDLILAMPGLIRQHQGNDGAFANAFYTLVEQDLRRPSIVLPPMVGLGGGLVPDLAQAALFANPELGRVAAQETNERRMRDAQILLASGRLTPQQFNTELLRMLSNDDPALTLVILSQLQYGSLTIPQREQVLGLLDQTPTTDQNFLLKISVLRRLPQLLLLTPEARVVDGAQAAALAPLRARAVLGLQHMLNPQHALFARQYETVRIAALAALADFGQGNDAATINAITGRLAFAGGNFAEPVPAVRHAAVAALNRLNPPNLSAILTTLIQHETDAATSALARDIRAEIGMQAQPNREQVEEQRQAITALILRGRDLRFLEGREYILAHHPLLFAESRHLQFSNAAFLRFGEGGIGWRWNIRDFEQRSRETFDPNGRNSLWVAARGGEARAVAGLAYIINSHGTDFDPGVRRDYLEYSSLLLAGLCVPDSPHRELARDWVVSLLNNPELGPREERWLLQAVRLLNSPDPRGQRALSNVEAARIFATVLAKRFRAQTRVPLGHADYQGHVDNQLELIRDLRRLRCRDTAVIALLRAMSDERGHINPDISDEQNRTQGRNIDRRVGQAAGQAADYLQDGVIASAEFIFSENRAGDTRPLSEQRTERPGDALATGAQRAAWISHALAHRNDNSVENINDEATVRAIFRAVHGLREVPRNHEVVTSLLGILNAQPPNQRLQLAAAYALLILRVQNGNDVSGAAIRTLANLAAHGRLPGYRREAREILEGPSPTPEHAANVATLLRRAEQGVLGINWIMERIAVDLRNTPSGPANPAQEAAAIGRAILPLRLEGIDPVETIARACLGKPFVDGDPRIPQLRQALEHDSERIRFIAAVMLLRMGPPAHRWQAAEVIASLVTEGSNATIRREAIIILERSVPLQLHNGFSRINLPNNRTIDTYWGQQGDSYMVETQAGLVRHVVLPDGSVRAFYWSGVGANARLIGYTGSNGTDYRLLRRDGERNIWTTGNNEISTTDETVAPNGDYSFTDSNGVRTTYRADGTNVYRHPNGTTQVYRNGRLISSQ